MGLNGPQRVTRVMSAPVRFGALRVLLRPRRAACPRLWAPQAVPRGSSSLALAPARSAPQILRGPAVAALPGGSGALLRPRSRVKGRCKGLSACGLRLKGFMPARLHLSAAARSRCAPRSFPPSPASAPRPGPALSSGAVPFCGPGDRTAKQEKPPRPARPRRAGQALPVSRSASGLRFLCGGLSPPRPPSTRAGRAASCPPVTGSCDPHWRRGVTA